MNPIVLAVVPPAVMALVFGLVVVADRPCEPHRDPARPFAVVDARTYRAAGRRIDRLLADGDPVRARCLMHAVCGWLRRELRTGHRRRRVRWAAELERWELRLEQLAPNRPEVPR